MTGPSSRCSDGAVVVLVAVLLVATAGGTATAVSVAETDVPEEAAVGSTVTATVTLTDLYRNPDIESWTLAGETELRAVTWTVTRLDQAGNRLSQNATDGRTLRSGRIDLDDGVNRVRIRVTGTVPAVRTYRYDPPQNVTVADLTLTRSGGSSAHIDRWTAHHYTPASRNARRAIENAEAAIDAAAANGAYTGEASRTYRDAIDAYEGRNFDLAVTLAERASRQAESARGTAETNRLLLYTGIGIVVVLLVGGVVYWYRRRDEPYDRLG